jgi:hypothetical protein
MRAPQDGFALAAGHFTLRGRGFSSSSCSSFAISAIGVLDVGLSTMALRANWSEHPGYVGD